MMLEIKDLHVETDGKEVLKGVNLSIRSGELHVLMGPNGSGKTTLAKAIMGHPQVKVTKGDVLVDGKSILDMPVNERAKLGLFLEFQNPIEVEGLGVLNFLNTAKGSVSKEKINYKEFMSDIRQNAERLKLKEELIGRSLNHGFSGGEKKKMEILQMAILKPKMAILDEPDSGLDIDAVKVVAENVNDFRKKNDAGLLIITHYSRILNYMAPDFIHVIADGKIIKEGKKELIEEIEKGGYKFDKE